MSLSRNTVSKSSTTNILAELESLLKQKITKTSRLGEGAHAVVYRATLENDEDIAIKQMKFESEKVHFYRNEINIMEEIDELCAKKNVVPPYLIGFYVGMCDNVQKQCLIAMEYMPDGSLRDYMMQHEKQHFSTHQCYEIIRQLTYALAFLHMLGIIHRDIAIDNILIDLNENQIKLADFGCASKIDEIDKDYSVSRPTHMAPEVIQTPANYGPKSDIYSVGIITYDLVTHLKRGYYLFVDDEVDLLFKRVLKGQRPSIPKNCDTRLNQLMADCWDANPEKRPEAGTITNQLCTILEEECKEGVTFKL